MGVEGGNEVSGKEDQWIVGPGEGMSCWTQCTEGNE